MKPVTFPGNVKPVHDGVYKRQTGFGVRWARWYKGRWRAYASFFDHAETMTTVSNYQCDNPTWLWTGLMKEDDAAK